MITKRKIGILRNIRRVHGNLELAQRVFHESKLRAGHFPDPSKPNGVPDQRDLVADAIGGGSDAWIIWFDGGRLDWFKELVDDYFTGELQACWNGGIGYTGDWAVRNLSGEYPGMGLFSMAALRQADAVDYDGREHFDLAPKMNMPDGSDMQERLATLGYLELNDDPVQVEPRETNKRVRKHLNELRGGVVRYLKPHPPFDGLEEMTAGYSKTKDTFDALANGDLTLDELEQAYVRTYKLAFECATDLVSDLDGDVILTADHGECLRCGQLFHSRRHKMHDHLVQVPWFRIDTVL